MMRWDAFARSAVFAAVAAAAYLPWMATLGGGRAAGHLYLVALTAAYLTGLGPRGGRRFVVAAGAAALGLALAAVVHSTGELVVGLGAVLATARSTLLYRARAARAVVTEVALVGGGLLFARALAAPSVLGTMLGIWGFLLVQSTFFLVGGTRPRPAAAVRRDPFEEAYARATALLDGGP